MGGVGAAIFERNWSVMSPLSTSDQTQSRGSRIPLIGFEKTLIPPLSVFSCSIFLLEKEQLQSLPFCLCCLGKCVMGSKGK